MFIIQLVWLIFLVFLLVVVVILVGTQHPTPPSPLAFVVPGTGTTPLLPGCHLGTLEPSSRPCRWGCCQNVWCIVQVPLPKGTKIRLNPSQWLWNNLRVVKGSHSPVVYRLYNWVQLIVVNLCKDKTTYIQPCSELSKFIQILLYSSTSWCLF